VGQVVTATPEEAFRMAEVVLHVNDNKGGVGCVDTLTEAEFTPLANYGGID